jgi:sugar/nucleoside kinase (ribokinase family)
MTAGKTYAVTAVASLTVDVSITGTDTLLNTHGLAKGLSTEMPTQKLYALIAEHIDNRSPGGPGCNVANGIALRGGKAAMIAKIGKDIMGAWLTQRVNENGTYFMPVAHPEASTTLLAAIATPDGERTFAHPDNAAGYHLGPEDIDEELVKNSSIVYLDSYLLFNESGREATRQAAEIAKQHGTRVAIALNNVPLVLENREALLKLARETKAILLGDQNEFMALYNKPNLGETMLAVNDDKLTAAITMGKQGAQIIHENTLYHVPANKIDNVIDTNGAGDQFAAGFLYGMATGMSAPDSGRQGALWASQVIQHKGAEPKVGLRAENKPGNGNTPKASTL